MGQGHPVTCAQIAGDEGVWYEAALVPSRTSPGPTHPSLMPSKASPGPMQLSPVLSRTSPGPARPSSVPARPSSVPSPSQSSPPSHQQQQPFLRQQILPELVDYFSGAVDGGEPQQLGRTRAQTARDHESIGDRPQTVGDGVAPLGRTRGQIARNQVVMQQGLLSLMAAREGTGHVLYLQAPPHANPLPTHAPGE